MDISIRVGFFNCELQFTGGLRNLCLKKKKKISLCTGTPCNMSLLLKILGENVCHQTQGSGPVQGSTGLDSQTQALGEKGEGPGAGILLKDTNS